MGRDRSRVLAALIAYLVLVVASTLVMDWFVMTGGGMAMTGTSKIGIDLRSVTVCTDAGPCASVSFSGIAGRGMYPTVAFVAFWGTILTALLVAFQAGTRIISGVANEPLSKMGTFVSLGMAGLAGAAGFLFGPEINGTAAEIMGVSFDRTWAPSLLVLAHLVGILTMHWAASQETLDTEYKPIVAVLPTARVVPQTQDIKPVGVKPVGVKPTPVERPTGDGIPQVVPVEKPATGPVPTMPEHLRKKLSYMTLSAEITRAGIDARQEDGELLLVMWRDVVGVVARRLPPEHEGATFVDVVSTAGATLRILPWTRITGDIVRGTGDDRARALVAAVVASCPSIKIDVRTQAFSENGEAAQLPDLAKLAAHDARLA